MQVNIQAAVRIYYEKLSLGGKEIREIFGFKSDSAATKKKKEVIAYFAKQDINPIHTVNNRLDTWRAFEAWGLDISDLEKRLKKLKQFGYISSEGVRTCTDTNASGAALQ